MASSALVAALRWDGGDQESQGGDGWKLGCHGDSKLAVPFMVLLHWMEKGIRDWMHGKEPACHNRTHGMNCARIVHL